MIAWLRDKSTWKKNCCLDVNKSLGVAFVPMTNVQKIAKLQANVAVLLLGAPVEYIVQMYR